MPSPDTIRRTAGGQRFSPLSVVGYVGWYKADSIVGLAANAPISQWNDSSGFARHLTQVTLGNRPLFKSAQVNGLPGVLFDGIDDFMSLPSLTLATDFTVLAAMTSTTQGELLGNTGVNRQFRINRSGTNSSFYSGGSEIIMAGGTTLAHDRKLLGWRRTGSTVSFRENAANRTGGTDSGSTTLDEVGNTIFGDPFGATLYELVIYNRFLTDADNDRLYYNYFKPRWSLP